MIEFIGGPNDGGETEQTTNVIFNPSLDKNYAHCYTKQNTQNDVRYIYNGVYDSATKKNKLSKPVC